MAVGIMPAGGRRSWARPWLRGASIRPRTRVSRSTRWRWSAWISTPGQCEADHCRAETRPGGGAGLSAPSMAVSGAGAGVALYDRAQTLEQLSAPRPTAKPMRRPSRRSPGRYRGRRLSTDSDRWVEKNTSRYLNVSDSLRRTGGDAWGKWNCEIKAKLVKLQNGDGPGRGIIALLAAWR